MCYTPPIPKQEPTNIRTPALVADKGISTTCWLLNVYVDITSTYLISAAPPALPQLAHLSVRRYRSPDLTVALRHYPG